ncbi:hypothetical protein PQX77_012845 [Marasmius sp. AFHP31]|nr:hypothetical protein PQX77_012845 [Marasmius sp. AFHP31]
MMFGDRQFYFIRNLPDDLAIHVQRNQPKTMSAVYEAARFREQLHGYRSGKSNHHGKPHQHSKKDHRNNSSPSVHTTPAVITENATPMPASTGEAPIPMDLDNFENGGGNGGSSNQSQVRCYRCNKRGHYAKDYRSAQKPSTFCPKRVYFMEVCVDRGEEVGQLVYPSPIEDKGEELAVVVRDRPEVTEEWVYNKDEWDEMEEGDEETDEESGDEDEGELADKEEGDMDEVEEDSDDDDLIFEMNGLAEPQLMLESHFLQSTTPNGKQWDNKGLPVYPVQIQAQRPVYGTRFKPNTYEAIIDGGTPDDYVTRRVAEKENAVFFPIKCRPVTGAGRTYISKMARSVIGMGPIWEDRLAYVLEDDSGFRYALFLGATG